MISTQLVFAIGLTLGLVIVILSIFVNISPSEAKRINSINKSMLQYRKTKQSLRSKIKDIFSGKLQSKSQDKKPHRKTLFQTALEIMERPDRPLRIGAKEFNTFRKINPFIFGITFGLAGFHNMQISTSLTLLLIGLIFGMLVPNIMLYFLYQQYQHSLVVELSEIMTYIVELRQGGQTIYDSIKGAMFSTQKLNPYLERLLQNIAIQGPKLALAAFGNETDIKEFKYFADILIQSINIDDTNMENFLLSKSKDIEYLEGLKKKRQFKNRKMLVEVITTIPFIMIPIIILIPLLLSANQNISQIK